MNVAEGHNSKIVQLKFNQMEGNEETLALVTILR